MIFRNGHISGFIDELTNALQNTDAQAILQEYHEEVSLGSKDNDSLIPLPILFVFLSDENNAPATMFTPEDRIKVRDYLIGNSISGFQEAADKFNIKFYPAKKVNSGGVDLAYPGIITLNMQDETSLKQYESYDPNIGTVTISQTHRYRDQGVAIASEALDNQFGTLPVRGIPHTQVMTLLQDELSIDLTKVYTVVLAHKLNTESMNSQDPGWATMTNSHPALSANGYPYVSFLSIPHFRNNFLDTLTNSREDIVNYYNSKYDELYSGHTPVESSFFYNLDFFKRLGHLLGNTFGLLPIGTPSLDDLISFTPASCENSTGCILDGGNGNCVDIAPLVLNNYFSEDITYYAWHSDWSDIVCSEDITLNSDPWFNFYQSVTNYMNFWNNSEGAQKVFSSSQIDYVRAGFETEGTVLKSIKDNAINFITQEATSDLYCLNLDLEGRYLPSTSAPRSKFVESSEFEKIKNKILSICNKLIFR